MGEEFFVDEDDFAEEAEGLFEVFGKDCGTPLSLTRSTGLEKVNP